MDPYTAAPSAWEQPAPEMRAAVSKPPGYITIPPHVLRTLIRAITVRRAPRRRDAASILQRAVDDADPDEAAAA